MHRPLQVQPLLAQCTNHCIATHAGIARHIALGVTQAAIGVAQGYTDLLGGGDQGCDLQRPACKASRQTNSTSALPA